jgi:predicted nucleotidyltransferase
MNTAYATADQQVRPSYFQTAQQQRRRRQSDIQQRYRRACQLAERAHKILTEKYGANDVTVFGSLLTPSLFHAESDVDLLVSGLDDASLALAQAELERLDHAIAIDVVSKEHASESLRRSIAEQSRDIGEDEAMSNGKIGSGLLSGGEEAALTARIRGELAEVSQAVDRAERLLSKSKASGDTDYLDGVALNLHSFYTGVEKIFEQIARVVDGGMPAGSDWHQQLLMQMTVELPQRRPAVIRRETRDCLDEYRRFRHTVRNLYTFNLRPARLQDLTTELRLCFQNLLLDIEQFCAFLERLSGQEQV